MFGLRKTRPRPKRSRLCATFGVIGGVLLGAASAHGAFPGQNGKIAFEAPEAGTFAPQIELVGPDGSGRGPLSGTPDSSGEPAWSADGNRIVFSRRNTSTFDDEIWVVAADGTGATQLTGGEDDLAPAFSPDGSRIVFSRNDGPPQFDNEIWIMNADGSGQTKLTDNAVWDTNPTFNAAGTMIAFDREVTGTGIAIFTMAPDGSGEAPLTPTNGNAIAFHPNFSPDGGTLTFSWCDRVAEGCAEPLLVASMPAGGGPVTELTSSSDPDHRDPAFSPDGTRIVFWVSDFDLQTNTLQTVASAGGAIVPLTTGDNDTVPDWQPVAASAGQAGASAKKVKRCRGVKVTILGTNGPDKLIGTAGRDVIHGMRGTDLIKGLSGNDRLCGGRGVDRIFGGRGRDVLFGGDHRDFLFGGPGRDLLFGGTPNAPVRRHIDKCVGGSGKDRLKNCEQRPG